MHYPNIYIILIGLMHAYHPFQQSKMSKPQSILDPNLQTYLELISIYLSKSKMYHMRVLCMYGPS